MVNRRREPRVSVARCEGMLRGSVPVTILDVSRGGFRFELRTSVRPGTVCDLKADLEGHHLTAQVVITRCTASGTVPDGTGGRAILYTVGARIIHLSEAADFDSWLSGLSGPWLSEDAGATLTAISESDAKAGEGAADRGLSRTAGDLMSRTVYGIHDDQTIEELVALLVAKEASGAPVLSRDGKLVGVVTAWDIVGHRNGNAPEAREPRFKRRRRHGIQLPPPETAGKGHLVRDIMTPAAVATIPESLTVEEVAKAMVTRRMNRLLVVRGETVVGVVNAVDLLEIPRPRPVASDAVEIEVLVPD